MLILSRRIAQTGIVIQFAALIRCLGEYYRLKYFAIEMFALGHVEPFIVGAAVTAIMALGAILFYFVEKYRLTAITSAINVVILLVLRSKLL